MAGALPEELVAFAHRLADAAGEIQRRWFRRPLPVDAKADSSPVTIADREAEAVMRELVARHRPGHGILGEEHGSERLDAEWVWVLDPIDGTRSFVCGRPLFATLIGLLHEGRPVLGVIEQGISRERWIGARGRPTLLNGRPCRARPCPGLAAAMLGCTSPQMFRTAAERAALDRVLGRVRQAIWGNDGYGAGLVAAGFLDLVVEADLEAYDVLPLVAVVEGAGGVVTDWEGRPPGLGGDQRMVVAGDRRAHAAALEALRAG